jgi:predicted Zn-dependent protease with MMP-like domain
MTYRTSREHFRRLVEETLRELPEEFLEYFTNIMVMVEDYPGRQEARKMDIPGDELLGLFSGTPYPSKGGFFNVPNPYPDTIILFKRNIENICSTEGELIEEIRKTLIHEVGHYFGLSEEDLRSYE